jgi:hypothetical protein
MRERAKWLASVKETPPIGTRWEKQERDWRWKEQAAIAGMSEQYEFIYSFTSRLLHATPVSLTTNQKLLEPGEMHCFWNTSMSQFSTSWTWRKKCSVSLQLLSPDWELRLRRQSMDAMIVT